MASSSDDTKTWTSVRDQLNGLSSYYNSDEEENERKEAELYRPQNILLALDAADLMEKAKLRLPTRVLTTLTGSVNLYWSTEHGRVLCHFGIEPPDDEAYVYKCIGGLDSQFVDLPYTIGNKEHQAELLRVLSLYLDELYPSS